MIEDGVILVGVGIVGGLGVGVKSHTNFYTIYQNSLVLQGMANALFL